MTATLKGTSVAENFFKMTIACRVFLIIASAHVLLVQATVLDYEWLSYNPAAERIPERAIPAGYDIDGSTIYISQMRVGREKIPSQLIPSKATSYAVNNGDVYKSPLTAIPTPILCGTNYAWELASLSSFPKNAIPCGKTENGDILYVGRAEYNGSMILGGVGPTRSALFAAYNGSEVHWFGMYKVLVYNNIDVWTRATFYDFPANAVVGGYDSSRNNIYVGLIRVGNHVVPAQINPTKQTATASYAGGIERSDEFQVLTGSNYKWVSVKKGAIPENVVIAGRTSDGEVMHFGRVIYKKLLIPGTILSNEKVLYISYLGKLRTVESGYEALVRVKGSK